MRSFIRISLAAAAIVIATTTSAVGVAGAAVSAPIPGGPAGGGVCAAKAAVARTAPTVATLRDFGNCEIDRRLITLVRLSAAVGGSAGLSSSDAAALSADIAAARSGLRSLKATIDTQTRIPALKVEIVQIVTRYRVYVLLGPQVRLSIAADDVIAIKPHFDGISTTLAARIAAAQAGGKDEAAAQTALNAMNAAVASAVAIASPISAQLVALTPAGFGSGGAGPVLRNARLSLLRARDYLKAAALDGRRVLADLE